MRMLRRHPVRTALAVALVIPPVWCDVVGFEARAVLPMMLVSGAFWFGITAWLANRSDRAHNPWLALAVGIASPVIAPLLSLPLAVLSLPLLPVFVLLDVDVLAGLWAIAAYGSAVAVYMPLETFPVGLGMGAVVAWLTRRGPQPPR